jgi:thymidylate synthase ThyX
MIPKLNRNVDYAIVADSANRYGSRLTSFLLRYPRFIHSEFLTHRVFSKNSASSRAIPTKDQLIRVINSPAMPNYWGSNKSGMQAGEPVSDVLAADAFGELLGLRNACVNTVNNLHAMGLHKQICNRYIEPFSHITVIATAVDLGLHNFFFLRCHPMAEPLMQELAYGMLDLYLASKPAKLDFGDYHMPFSDHMPSGLTIQEQIKVSVARCCWVSYMRHDKDAFDVLDAYKRHDECIEFKHMSPLEHVARAERLGEIETGPSNFDVNGIDSGWVQYRKEFQHECAANVDLHTLQKLKPEWLK